MPRARRRPVRGWHNLLANVLGVAKDPRKADSAQGDRGNVFVLDLLIGLLCFDCFHHLADIAQASPACGILYLALTPADTFFLFDLFQDG